ncbi:MAG: hypothetical protein IPP68_11200 [Elusimicrobia bacterium]|nr:hypothetical protein [Elusimicrobiota bacterium]
MAMVFLATNGLLAYAPETNLWAERRKASPRQAPALLASRSLGPPSDLSLASQFPVPQTLAPSLSQNVARSIPKRFLLDRAKLLSALSPAHGTIRKVSFGPRPSPRGPVIVHIQDVHRNPEAQRNIREAVRSLIQSGQVNLVALEGAAAEIRLQPFVDFPNRQAVEATADHLLKENEISGPIHAALTAQGKLPRILGIDDPLHYQANVQAYRDSAPKLDGARAWVKELKSGIEAEKKRVFSPALLAFDEKVKSYREGKTSLGDYVLLFSSPPRGPTTEQISLFQKALALERSLDFRQVEAERTRLIEALTPTLTKAETDALLARCLAYRSGQWRYADFYAGLKDLCRRKGVDLTAYPAMDEYVKYLLLADGIDAEKLMEDLAAGEKAAYAALARTEAEKRLLANSRRAWLTGKLVDFSLTPVEWREYKADAVPGPAAARSLPPLPPALASFESFYREADARDEAMANNVGKAASPGPEPMAAVLVTGGYHAEGIAKALTAKGFTVLSYVPKIEKIDTAQGSAYLSVFTQEKTPLDRLFEGQQLFLANEPVKACDVQLTAPGLIAVADRAKTFGSVEKSFLSLLPPALAARIKKIVVKTSGEATRLNVLFKDGWAYTVGSTPGDSSTGPRFVTEIEKQSAFSISDGIRRALALVFPLRGPGPTRAFRGPPGENAGAGAGSAMESPGPEGVNGAPVLVSADYVPGIYRENELGNEFSEELNDNRQFSRESIIDRQLTLLVLNGELEASEKEEMKRKAVDLLSAAEGAPGFNPTTMERDVLTCGIVRDVVKGNDGFNPFSVRNLKTNNVAAALQEDGIALRQRLLRLLYCFEALKHLPNEELYHGEERSIADRLREKVRSFDDRALAIDAFESYVQRVVRSPKPITVPVFLDDNGEVVFVLRFILDQMAMNKNLRFVLVPRNGQYREDASVDDVKRILNSPLFKKEVHSVGDRLRVVPGCAGDGVDVRKFSRELVDVLLSADVVLSIGQMNFEGLNTFKKDLYFFFVSMHLGPSVVSGVPTGKGVFAYLPAGTKAFSTYADRLFRRLRFGSGVTIPVAGHTLLEAAAISPENKINEPFEVLNDSPKGQGPGGAPKPGRATSRWMAQVFLWLGAQWGGPDAAKRWGAHYMAHAPVYEWSLGFGAAAANLGAAFFLTGSAWAVVPLLLTALFLPSHALPARWLNAEVEVDWVKAGVMAAFYFALVAAAPLLALDAGWTQTVLQAAGWGLALFLHRCFDPIVDKLPQTWEWIQGVSGALLSWTLPERTNAPTTPSLAESEKSLSVNDGAGPSSPLAAFLRRIKNLRPSAGLPFNNPITIVRGPDGIYRVTNEVSPSRAPGSARTARGPPAEKAEPEAVDGTSVLVSRDYVPGIYRENELGKTFWQETVDNRQFSRESIIDRQLTLLVLNGELEASEKEEMKRKAVDLLSAAEGAPGFNPTTMERDVLTCGIVRTSSKATTGSTFLRPELENEQRRRGPSRRRDRSPPEVVAFALLL